MSALYDSEGGGGATNVAFGATEAGVANSKNEPAIQHLAPHSLNVAAIMTDNHLRSNSVHAVECEAYTPDPSPVYHPGAHSRSVSAHEGGNGESRAI